MVQPRTENDAIEPNSKTILMLLIIMVVSFAVYANALFNGFVFDDLYQVVENRWIRDIKFIPDMFFKNVWSFGGGESNYYRPLMHFIYMVCYHLFGLSACGYHLMNILFHSGVSLLVFLLTSELLRAWRPFPANPFLAPPFIAAILFATHPVHTEVVTPVMGIVDLALAFFYLLSFYGYIRSGEGAPRAYLLSVVAFFVAILCKEPALTLPVVLLAYDFTYQREKFRLLDFLKRMVPYLLASGVYFALRFLALGGFITSKTHAELTPFQYFINIFPLFVQYLEKLLLPVNLNFLHNFHPITSLLEGKGFFSLILIVALILLISIAFKKNRAVFIGLLLITLPLLPVLYIPALSQELLNAFAERYLYLPSSGFVILLALLLAWVRKNLPRVGVTLALLLYIVAGLYSVGTILRNPVWKDNFTLFTDTVKKSPNDPVAHDGLGEALLKRKQIDEAIAQFQIALRLKPNLSNAYNNLGMAYRLRGLTDPSIRYYQLAIRFGPRYAVAHYNLANVYGDLGRIDEAIENYRIALRLKPGFAEAHNNLAIAYAEKGWLEKAIEQFEAAVQWNPDNPSFRQNLSKAYEDKRRIQRY